MNKVDYKVMNLCTCRLLVASSAVARKKQLKVSLSPSSSSSSVPPVDCRVTLVTFSILQRVHIFKAVARIFVRDGLTDPCCDGNENLAILTQNYP